MAWCPDIDGAFRKESREFSPGGEGLGQADFCQAAPEQAGICPVSRRPVSLAVSHSSGGSSFGAPSDLVTFQHHFFFTTIFHEPEKALFLWMMSLMYKERYEP